MMNDLIQFNKFSELHDGRKIIFCKTDFLSAEFEIIEKMNSEVVLISGNSDFAVNDVIANYAAADGTI